MIFIKLEAHQAILKMSELIQNLFEENRLLFFNNL